MTGSPCGVLLWPAPVILGAWLSLNNRMIQRTLKCEAMRIANWATETYAEVKAKSPECAEAEVLVRMAEGLCDVPAHARARVYAKCESIEGLCYMVGLDLGALRGWMNFRCLQFTRYMDHELYARGFRPQSRETKERVLAAMDLLVNGWQTIAGVPPAEHLQRSESKTPQLFSWPHPHLRPGFFSYKGRMNRRRYLCTILAIGFMSGFLEGFIEGFCGTPLPDPVLAADLMFQIVFAAIASFAVVKRWHDIGASGLNFFWGLVPIVNVVTGVMLLFVKGTSGPNKYGLDPLGTGQATAGQRETEEVMSHFSPCSSQP